MRRALVLAGLALAGCGAQPRLSPAPTPSGKLYLAGREPGSLTRVDVAAGTATAHQVPQLTGGDPPYFLAFTGGRLVVFGLGEATSFAPDLSDPRGPFSDTLKGAFSPDGGLLVVATGRGRLVIIEGDRCVPGARTVRLCVPGVVVERPAGLRRCRSPDRSMAPRSDRAHTAHPGREVREHRRGLSRPETATHPASSIARRPPCRAHASARLA